MDASIGIIEMKNIAKAIFLADVCLKTAAVKLFCRVTCPGKFMVLISGDISAVQSAIDAGLEAVEGEILDSVVIGKVDDSIMPALMGSASFEQFGSLGIVETFTVPAAIKAADIAVKSADTQIIEIRAAQGLGGKGLVYYTGSYGAVKLASETIIRDMGSEGTLMDSVVVPYPHTDLWEILT